MPGAQYGTTRPLENIAAAKARAKAALNEGNPKLTHLEQAFYDLYQQQSCQSRQQPPKAST